MSKSKIIIDEIIFYIKNFKNEDYKIEVSAVDIDEYDDYRITISNMDELKKSDRYYFFIDSSGNTTDDIPDNDITKYVLNILFINRQHGIIRGF